MNRKWFIIIAVTIAINVFVYSPSNGATMINKLWEIDNIYYELALDSQRAYFSKHNNNRLTLINSFDATSGKMIWSSSIINDTPLFSQDFNLAETVLYVVHQAEYDDIKKVIYCIDRNNGSIEWSTKKSDLNTKYSYSIGCIISHASFFDDLYFLTHGQETLLWYISADTGNPELIGALAKSGNNTLVGNLYVVSSSLFFVMGNNASYCFNYINGKLTTKWSTENHWSNKTSSQKNVAEYGSYNNEILLLHGSDYEGSLEDNYFSLFAIDIESGKTLWKVKPSEHFDICEDVAVVSYKNGEANVYTINGLDVYTGDLIWQYEYEAGFPSEIILFEIDQDKLVFGIGGDSRNCFQQLDVHTGVFIREHRDMIDCIDCTDTSLLMYSSGKVIYDTACYSLAECVDEIAITRMKFGIDKYNYFIGNKEFQIDVAPVIEKNRTLLPARYVVEPLGGQVFWDGEQRKVTCILVAPDNPDTEEYKENIVELWIDNPIAKVNGEEVQIDPYNPDVVPTIINDRTMVPMRFLAESLGCEVEWVADTKEIILTYTP